MKARKRSFWILLLVLCMVGLVAQAHAKDSYMGSFNTRYSTSVWVNNCAVCHPSVPGLNSYGSDYKNNTHDLAKIELFDSDSDGTNNKTEITVKGTNPGVYDAPAPPPPPSDTTPPNVTSFIIPSNSTSFVVPISSFTATDSVGVTGYMVTESSTKPGALDPGWSASAPTSYTFATEGSKTLYAWAKDAAGNVSNSLSATVAITLPPAADATPPTVTAFTIPTTATTLTVPINALAATDNSGVTGYLVNESSTKPGALDPGWSASAPTSYTFAGQGAKTLYAWAKDAAGNVSNSLSAAITVTLPSQPPPSNSPDLSLWVGKWLKITTKFEGYYLGNSSIRSNEEESGSDENDNPVLGRDRETGAGYLKITSWEPNQRILQAEHYQIDPSTGQWVSDPLSFNVIDGSPTDFFSWSQIQGDLTIGFTMRVQGKLKDGALRTGTIKTMGGYYYEIAQEKAAGDNTSRSCAGAFSLSGSLVPESKVPAPH